MVEDLQRAGQSRVFTIEDRAAPSHAPVYQSLAKMGDPDWPQGEVTPVRIPDPDRYDAFIIADEIIGEAGLPSLPLEFYKERALSEVLKLVRKGCPIDIQIHVGACQNPSDFNGGWDYIIVLEGARPTNYGGSNFGALSADEQNPTLETVPFTGRDYYEIGKVTGGELGGSQIVQEVIGVTICDARSCGTCGSASDGCQKVFAITKTAGGSPGLAAEIIYSSDGGTTLGEAIVTTLAANEEPKAIACVGTYLVVISQDSLSLHYALTADVLAGIGTWAEITTGFVAAKGPNAMFSLGQSFTWMVGQGGYVYFASDITSGVSVQDAGVATVQNLNAIHGFDRNNLVAVGAANAVIVTENGGETWAAKTGPDVGVVLNTVWMKSKLEWLVGTAGGKLWYTINGGTSWAEKPFNNSGSGAVRKITFSTPTVGWMAHDYTPVGGVTGRVLRTIDGGFSWYVIPENRAANLPTNDRINDIIGCGGDPNVLFAGGLGANAVDGILIKAAA